MDNPPPERPSLQAFLLRALRISASTVAIVELLRNNWRGGALAATAWLVFSQVEKLPSPSDDEKPNGSN